MSNRFNRTKSLVNILVVMTILWTGNVCVSVAFGQNNVLTCHTLHFIPNLSPELNVLLSKIHATLEDPNELKQIIVPVLIKYDLHSSTLASFKYVKIINKNYAIAYLNPLQLKKSYDSPSFKYISLGGRSIAADADFAKMLSPDIQIFKNSASESFSIVGIIDQNNKLSLRFNEDLASRVIAYWDQTEFISSKSEQNGALELVPRQASSVHGSIVSSIINKVAKDASYVIVDSSLEKADSILALDLIKNIATEALKPAVVNISAGVNAGPHDGTSLFEEMISSYIDKKFLVVTSAGDSGSRNHHIEFTRDSLIDNSINLKLQIPEDDVDSYEASIDLWFDCDISCQVTIQSSQFSRFDTIPPKAGYIYETDNGYLCACNDLSQSRNKRTNILIVLKAKNSSNDFAGTLDIELTFSDPVPFVCDGWLTLGPGCKGHFKNYTSSGKTISSPATAKKIISVGVFSEEGGNKIFSSEGPTCDMRIKPDVFLKWSYPTSYASAVISGMLANAISANGNSAKQDGGILTIIAKKRKDVILPSELFNTYKK